MTPQAGAACNIDNRLVGRCHHECTFVSVRLPVTMQLRLATTTIHHCSHIILVVKKVSADKVFVANFVIYVAIGFLIPDSRVD